MRRKNKLTKAEKKLKNLPQKTRKVLRNSLFLSFVLNLKGFGLLYSLKLISLFGLRSKYVALGFSSDTSVMGIEKVKDTSTETLLKEFLVKQKENFSLLVKKQADRYVVLKSSGHYKGRRYIFSLPCRGQRTHTNARTCKRAKMAKKRIGIKKKK
jgi:ribosomal protein S13